MTLIPARWHRSVRAARNAYFALQEDPAADTARDTLRHNPDPAARFPALAYLADREHGLYRLHDAAFGRTPWHDGIAGDAATALALGAMILRLLRAVELARAEHRDSWRPYWAPADWGRIGVHGIEAALADSCAPLLGQLVEQDDPTEIAVLYTRLWIAAYPVIGGQAAEWIAVLGNDWQCRAAGVTDGPDTVLVLPDAGRGAVQYLPAAGG